jgi:hypothetical protein
MTHSKRGPSRPKTHTPSETPTPPAATVPGFDALEALDADAVVARVDALVGPELRTGPRRTISLQLAGLQGLSLVGATRPPAVAEVLPTLPVLLWQPSWPKRLEDLSRACLDYDPVLQVARLKGPAVDAMLMAEAVTRRDRMWGLFQHHFGADPVATKAATGIGGPSRAAVASDLKRLVGLLLPRLAKVKGDEAWFDPQDLVRGPQLSEAILSALTDPEDTAHAQRAEQLWYAFEAQFGDMRATLEVLYRNLKLGTPLPRLLDGRKKAKKKKPAVEGPADEAAVAEAVAKAVAEPADEVG